MKLVYLDTSQIHLLPKERVQNKERFSNFLKMWKDNRCVLALSRIHLFEICRYDDPEMRQSRYRLFEDLIPLSLRVRVLRTSRGYSRAQPRLRNESNLRIGS